MAGVIIRIVMIAMIAMIFKNAIIVHSVSVTIVIATIGILLIIII